MLKPKSISKILDINTLTGPVNGIFGWRLTPGGMNWGGDGDTVSIGGKAVGTRTEVNFRISNRRRVVVCSNALNGHVFNLASLVAGLVKDV